MTKSAHQAPRKFNSLAQVSQYAEQKQKTILLFEDKILDVTTFAQHHPGGSMLLSNSKFKNIDQEMSFHHPLTIEMANTMAIGTFKTEISRIIEPDKPLLTQIWGLTHEQYLKVVDSPHWLFVPSPRMFQNDFIEGRSHCKWFIVPILPIIVISYMFSRIESWQEWDTNETILASLMGFLFFTFVQYALHRFIFHSQKYLPNSKIARYIHFFAHGIHHMLPNDPDRLVLPPFMYMVIFTLGYFTVGQIVKFQCPIFAAFFWTFFQIGYCFYDICHYALHHVDTTKNQGSYFHKLQKYHNQHHFGGQCAGFGVSSPLWDVILRTGYQSKKKN